MNTYYREGSRAPVQGDETMLRHFVRGVLWFNQGLHLLVNDPTSLKENPSFRRSFLGFMIVGPIAANTVVLWSMAQLKGYELSPTLVLVFTAAFFQAGVFLARLAVAPKLAAVLQAAGVALVVVAAQREFPFRLV